MPNVGPAYDKADLLFEHTTAGFQGSGLLQLISNNGYNETYSPQMWRTLDQNGDNFPPEHRAFWRMKFTEELTFDPGTPGDEGYALQFQVYRTAPFQFPMMAMGAARRTDRDPVMRWSFDIKERNLFDLPREQDLEIPIGDWIYMETAWLLDPGGSGYFHAWQDGQQILDYNGPTLTNPYDSYGMSWMVYTHLSPQIPFRQRFDEVGTGLVRMYDKLILPSPTGGFS